MTMGIQKHNRAERVFSNKTSEFFPFMVKIASWINNNAFLLSIVQQISVLLKGIKLKNFNVCHSLDFLGKCVNFRASCSTKVQEQRYPFI